MPRKTGITAVTEQVTPFDLGPKLIDDEGDSVTDPNLDAVRTSPVGVGGITLANVQSTLEESLEELRRIRQANELIIGQEVD